MGKIYGLNGVMEGKIGNTVLAVRNGVQIARQYQPIVANPSTPAQVEARAKLKLMSQLAAVMAPVIAIPREGIVSARNMFTKLNYGAATYSEGQADIELNAIKITKSVVSLPGVNVSRSTENINVSLSSAATVGSAGYSRVVYTMFVKEDDNSLRYVGSTVVTTPTAQGTYNGTLPLTNRAVVVYAYGVRDNTDAAKAVFGDLTVVSAETVAKLIVSRVVTNADITLTETRAGMLAASNE